MSTMTAKKYDLSCLGILVADVFGKSIDRFPEKGTSEYFNDLQIHPGGCAYNTAVDAARIGMNVGVLGKLGRDLYGKILEQSLEHAGVDTSGVSFAEGEREHTAFSFVMVPEDGQRRIYHTMGVNGTYGPEEVNREIIAASRILHIAGVPLMPALTSDSIVDLLRYAKGLGVLTSLDPVVKPDIADYIVPCLPYLDIFLPNVDESFYITGLKNPSDQLRFYLDHGVELAGIKLGEEGSLISDGKQTITCGIYSVPVKDTCGAGDAFVAGFLYGRLQNWDLERCARFATAASAFCVQSIGATPASLGVRELTEFIGNNRLKEKIICH